MHPKLDTDNPYVVMSYIAHGIKRAKADANKKLREFPEMREQAEKSIASMERSYAAVRQLQSLHLSQCYRKELRSIPWWRFKEKSDFIRNEDLWLKEKHDTLKKEAEEIDWDERE